VSNSNRLAILTTRNRRWLNRWRSSLLIQDIQGRPLLAFRDELQRKGATVEAVVGDVSQVEDCQAMIQAAVETYGRVDVVVANAGIIPLGDVLESTVDDWNKVMAIDGRGMFLTCKYAIEAMLKTGGGSIVCLSSICGIAGQNRQATYGPAKFVATGITKLGGAAGHGDRHSPAGSRSVAHVGMSRNKESRSNGTDKLA